MAAQFEPENDLERSLMRAATDAHHRPQFIADLLEGQLVIIDDREPKERAQTGGTLAEGSSLPLRTIELESRPHIPIFSSPTRLHQAANGEDLPYLVIGARIFFELTRGADLILNPMSAYGKQFYADEIADMLDGAGGREITLQQETEVLLAQPAVYPGELIERLAAFFTTCKDVEAAYLCLIASGSEPPHTLIAIECQGGWGQSPARQRLGTAMQAVAIPNPPVDFTDCQGPFANYFQSAKIEPFYRRPGKILGLF